VTRYLVRRLPSVAAVLVIASILVFGIIRAIPGDPATTLAGPDAPPETIAAIRHDLGLDRSVVAQYLSWTGSVVRFDLGRSYLVGGDISDLVRDGLLNTAVLALTALVLAVAAAVPLALWWAGSRRRWVPGLLTGTTTLWLALPPFVSGVLLVLVFGVLIPVLPTGGVPPGGFLARPDITVQYLALPAICLALPVAATLARFLAEALRTELAKPYVVTARALGIPPRRILLRYALRNAAPTAVVVLGIQVGNLLAGAVLVELIFAWPGLGQLVEQAIQRRDYPVVQVLLLLSVTVFVVVQLAGDLVHAGLDPRVRIGGES
jgi:peptide/nickel transport system permease protein